MRPDLDRLLARLRAHGFIDDYQGVRIAKDGTRFRISGAVAALFREWGGRVSRSGSTHPLWTNEALKAKSRHGSGGKAV